MDNDNKTVNAAVDGQPKPGTKDAIKAELDQANAALAAAQAELEALKAAKASEPVADKTVKKVEREKIFVPRGASNEDPNVFISVNGVNYLLPRGKESEVPVCVANEWRRMQKAQEYLDRSKDRMLGR